MRAALELRKQRPETGVLVLSQYYEDEYALDLIGEQPEGVGSLLKERVRDVEAFVQAVARGAAGGSALDPEVVGRMLGRHRPHGPLLDRLHGLFGSVGAQQQVRIGKHAPDATAAPDALNHPRRSSNPRCGDSSQDSWARESRLRTRPAARCCSA